MIDGLNRVRTAVAWVAVAAWVASLIVDAAISDYDVPAAVHGR